MFAVIFIVQPKKDRFDYYVSLAKSLKPDLERIDGFIDNERFGSKRSAGRVLSLSTWRDEKAVIRWRTLGIHHEVQEKGRFEVFEDYHLRVGEIVADDEIPRGQKLYELRFDETEIGNAEVVTISELSPTKGEKPASIDLVADLRLPKSGIDGVVDHEVFESIYNPGKLLLLVAWRDKAAAEHWKPRTSAEGKLRHRSVRVIRDYGMSDRREAPQFYSDVKTTVQKRERATVARQQTIVQEAMNRPDLG
jgi:heme-degrading monooxygenase HmoA